MPIIYLENRIPRDPLLRPGPESPWYWKSRSQARHTEDPAYQDVMCVEGTWGAQIIEDLAPQPGDYVIPKTSYSGFVGTPLDRILRRLQVRYLFLTGIGTPTCVDATARDAYFHEYWPVLLADCCGAIQEETHHQALAAIQRRYGWVTSSANFIATFPVEASAGAR